MRLIDSITVGRQEFHFYDGIDFDFIESDLSDRRLVFFVESWETEMKIWERSRRIESAIDGTPRVDRRPVLKENVAVYCTGGNLETVYGLVRDKIARGLIE